MLASFYKSYRYDRYSFIPYSIIDKEKEALISFIQLELDIEIDATTGFGITPNDARIKNFIGKVIGLICDRCYEGITNEANRLNIYTYEIPTFSKAFKIFLSKEYTFKKERIFSREIITYLLSSNKKGVNSNILSGLNALDFDPASEADYFQALESDLKKLHHMDELKHHYTETIKDPGERFEALEAGVSELYSYLWKE